MAVATLTAGEALAECLRSLESQTLRRFEVVVVDNSGARRVESASVARVIYNPHNAGFGAAVNQVFRATSTPYIATLNDDAVAGARWLEELVGAAETNPRAGMLASRVMLAGSGLLDSAGMLLAADGSSKQRGHGQPPGPFCEQRETLFPSGSAALYRRAMLDEIGLFDETFFLYCEDTDLGLRARWAGWECLYVPEAAVEHRYSHTAGGASPLKAYYVERNRLYTAVKNFPARMLWRIPFASCARYFWHIVSLAAGAGKTGEFHDAGHGFWLLPFLVARAHAATLLRLPRLISQRRRIRAARKLTSAEFEALARRHAIPVREVASL